MIYDKSTSPQSYLVTRDFAAPRFSVFNLPCLQDFSSFVKSESDFPGPLRHKFTIEYDRRRYHPWTSAFGLKIQNYLDDFMGYHRNPVTSLHQMSTILRVLIWLGVDVGLAKKIFGPSCNQVLTGYLLNTIDFSISLKPGKPEKIITRVKLLLECDRPPLRLLQQVARDMAWSSKVL